MERMLLTLSWQSRGRDWERENGCGGRDKKLFTPAADEDCVCE